LFTTMPAIWGRDLVAYQQGLPDGSPGIPGNPDFAYNFSGFQFWFRSNENMKLFIDNPWRFIPAYGGFGAWGVCCEGKWKPELFGPAGGVDVGWRFIDGKLYLNQYEQYRDGFINGGRDNIKLGDEKWKSWWGKLYAGPMNTKCWGGHDQHDVDEDFCGGNEPENHHMDYSSYLEKFALHKSLLDKNYFSEPRFDCFYQAPPANASIPPASTVVSPPQKCPSPPTPVSPDLSPERKLIYWVGFSVIGCGCVLGVLLGTGLYIYRKSKAQPGHSLIPSEEPPQKQDVQRERDSDSIELSSDFGSHSEEK